MCKKKNSIQEWMEKEVKRLQGDNATQEQLKYLEKENERLRAKLIRLKEKYKELQDDYDCLLGQFQDMWD